MICSHEPCRACWGLGAKGTRGSETGDPEGHPWHVLLETEWQRRAFRREPALTWHAECVGMLIFHAATFLSQRVSSQELKIAIAIAITPISHNHLRPQKWPARPRELPWRQPHWTLPWVRTRSPGPLHGDPRGPALEGAGRLPDCHASVTPVSGQQLNSNCSNV